MPVGQTDQFFLTRDANNTLKRASKHYTLVRTIRTVQQCTAKHSRQIASCFFVKLRFHAITSKEAFPSEGKTGIMSTSTSAMIKPCGVIGDCQERIVRCSGSTTFKSLLSCPSAQYVTQIH
eukprot:5184258-Amphidinium_carterae.1